MKARANTYFQKNVLFFLSVFYCLSSLPVFKASFGHSVLLYLFFQLIAVLFFHGIFHFLYKEESIKLTLCACALLSSTHLYALCAAFLFPLADEGLFHALPKSSIPLADLFRLFLAAKDVTSLPGPGLIPFVFLLSFLGLWYADALPKKDLTTNLAKVAAFVSLLLAAASLFCSAALCLLPLNIFLWLPCGSVLDFLFKNKAKGPYYAALLLLFLHILCSGLFLLNTIFVRGGIY